MKILFVNVEQHLKNLIGFDLLLNYKPTEVIKTLDPSYFGEEYDLVIVSAGDAKGTIFYPSCFPKAKCIMYGPQFFSIPCEPWKGPTQTFPSFCFYNTLSPWVDAMCREFGGLSLMTKQLPYPVATDLFCPSDSEKPFDCFIYYKNRSKEDILYAIHRLQTLGLSHILVQYGHYHQDMYIKVLQQVRFGVWVGGHETQGFAFQEALSCNVPLAVWDVTSMFDEVNHLYENSYKHYSGTYKLAATTASYWDPCCGEIFTKKEEFDDAILKVSNHTASYTPREFILKTLSPKACYERLEKVVSELSKQTS
jgi:hypothetical protein